MDLPLAFDGDEGATGFGGRMHALEGLTGALRQHRGFSGQGSQSSLLAR